MVPVLLCIVLLVLSSGAVLHVILERNDEPTGAPPPAPPPRPRPAPVVQAAPPRAGPAPRALIPPLPRHRIRSSALLAVLVVVTGALVAAGIGTVLALAAFALRSSVTS